jgi:hypothetical protein
LAKEIRVVNSDVKHLSDLVARIDRGNSPSTSINESVSEPSTPRAPSATRWRSPDAD